MNNWQQFIDIFKRIKQRNFKGNTGLVIKNSFYNSASTIIEKVGAMIFVIILARILLPELFGLYSLALSTILLFISISGLGVGETLIRFVSKALGNNKKSKAKSYVIYLSKLKVLLLFIVIISLAISSKFISQIYSDKPIFLALIAGLLYIFLAGLVGFVQLLFNATNNFKMLFIRQIIFQTLRLIIVPILVLYSLKYFNTEIIVPIVILSLSFVWFLTLCFLLIFANKIPFLRTKADKLVKKERKKINKFVFGLSILSLSGLFFGYIDILMLGGFVAGAFLGYYQSAFTLVSSFASLIFFSGVLLPIFSRIKGKRLENGFKKSLKITFLFSLIMFLSVFIFAPTIIKVIYGSAYLDSINLLRILSLLIISLPLIFIYTSYFVARGKIKAITKLLVVSILINIFLNCTFLLWLIDYGPLFAVIGVCIATIISKYFYLFGLIFSRKKLIKNE